MNCPTTNLVYPTGYTGNELPYYEPDLANRPFPWTGNELPYYEPDLANRPLMKRTSTRARSITVSTGSPLYSLWKLTGPE